MFYFRYSSFNIKHLDLQQLLIIEQEEKKINENAASYLSSLCELH